MAKRKAVHRYAFLTKSYVATVAVIAAFWLACAYSFFQVKDVEPLQGFVPHEILGIAADAPLAKVKKAYRKLSREKHPDKNPGNPLAARDFMRIAKAYMVSGKQQNPRKASSTHLFHPFSDYGRSRSKNELCQVR